MNTSTAGGDHFGPSTVEPTVDANLGSRVAFAVVCIVTAIIMLFAYILRRIEQLERPRYVELTDAAKFANAASDPYAENDVDDNGVPGRTVL